MNTRHVVFAKGKTHQASICGGGIEIINMPARKSIFVQGDDVECLLKDLEFARTTQQIDNVLDAYDDIMDTEIPMLYFVKLGGDSLSQRGDARIVEEPLYFHCQGGAVDTFDIVKANAIKLLEESIERSQKTLLEIKRQDIHSVQRGD